MPEGDAVLRSAIQLDLALAGAPLEFAELRWPTLGGVDLTGRTVRGTDTYGKHLLTRLDDDRTLHSHFRMDGSWQLRRTPTHPPAHPSADAAARRGRTGPSHRVRAVLATRAWQAIGVDLGMLDLLPTSHEIELLRHLGPDVLTLTGGEDSASADTEGHRPRRAVEDTRPTRWPTTASIEDAGRRIASHGARPIGEVLLDQRVVAGIGTIFCAESLFAIRASPWAPAASVDAVALLSWCRGAMRRSVAMGRTATTTMGKGTFVHGRLGKPCLRCRTRIAVDAIGRPPSARPGFYCPTCQPDHRAGAAHQPYRRP